MRAFLAKLHHWTGITAGLVLFVLALSGSILVFDDEIDRALNPHLFAVEEGAPSDLDAGLAVLKETRPDFPLAFIRLPRTPEHPVEFWSSDEPHRIAYVDAGAGKLLGIRGEKDGLVGFLKDLHIHLLMGENGHTANGIVGIVVLFLLISGAVLAWRKGRFVRIFKPRLRGAPLAASAFDLHRFTGTVGWALLFISALTGVMLVFYRVTAYALLLTLGGTPPSQPPAIERVEGAPLLGLEEIKEIAAREMPGAVPTWIRLPADEKSAVVVRYRHEDDPHPNGTTYGAFHPQTGTLVSSYAWEGKGAGMWLSDLKYPIHIGDFWGPAGPVIVLATGIVPLILMGSGTYLFFRRRGFFRK